MKYNYSITHFSLIWEYMYYTLRCLGFWHLQLHKIELKQQAEYCKINASMVISFTVE